MNIRVHARLWLGFVGFAIGPGCAAAVTPDATLMAGWTTKDVDVSGHHFQLEHPPAWRIQAQPIADDIPAVNVRIVVPRSFGPRLLITAFAAPQGFPGEGPARQAKVSELLAVAVAEVTHGSPSQSSEVMEVEASSGGTYQIKTIIDDALPAQPTSPDKFKYVTVGVMADRGWIVHFTALHHEPEPPENEQLIGLVRTIRVTTQ